jgi:hypothetical protein
MSSGASSTAELEDRCVFYLSGIESAMEQQYGRSLKGQGLDGWVAAQGWAEIDGFWRNGGMYTVSSISVLTLTSQEWRWTAWRR